MGVDDLVGSGSKEISLSSESERLSWIEKRFDVSILSSEKKDELKFGRPHWGPATLRTCDCSQQST